MSALPSPTWSRGMYGCPQDMFTAEQMRQYAEAVRAEGYEAGCDDAADEYGVTMDAMADLLHRTANALKGEPPPLWQHSWHDLPEEAAQLVADLARGGDA